MLTRRPWTTAEVALFRDLYPDLHAADVAVLLERTISSVYQAAQNIGIHKSAEYLASVTAGRIQRGHQHPSMVATRFQPGQMSWNKGKKGTTGLHPNCRATQFKTRAPSESRNYAPIGTLRVCADGYLEQKVTDDRSLAPARRWTAVHRLVWERTHGPIPTGHVVVYRPGCLTTEIKDITVERLECITRAELARRNHPRSKSPELAKLEQLKGAITRQVNRIAREAQETPA